jgi:DNA-binding MarR family transcriptional regulator
MTRIAAALGKAGYVKRISDPSDRRYVYLEATERGRRLLDEGRRRRLARLAELLSGLDGSQRDDCARALSILANVL